MKIQIAMLAVGLFFQGLSVQADPLSYSEAQCFSKVRTAFAEVKKHADHTEFATYEVKQRHIRVFLIKNALALTKLIQNELVKKIGATQGELEKEAMPAFSERSQGVNDRKQFCTEEMPRLLAAYDQAADEMKCLKSENLRKLAASPLLSLIHALSLAQAFCITFDPGGLILSHLVIGHGVLRLQANAELILADLDELMQQREQPKVSQDKEKTVPAQRPLGLGQNKTTPTGSTASAPTK